MTSPLPSWAAACGVTVCSIRSHRAPQPSIPELRAATFSSCAVRLTISEMRRSPLARASTSRGLMRPTAAFEIILSRSPTSARAVRTAVRMSGLSCRLSTTSCLPAMAAGSLRGIATHSLSRREPIGQQQRSITCSSDVPSCTSGAKISRLRKVKRSIHTNSSRSMREMLRIWSRLVCSVISR